MRPDKFIAASIVATVAFVAYSRTLLPGVDLGDTGGFQAAVLWPETTARQAYPLYYALAAPFVELLTPAAPARGLNLFSAVAAAAAAGLLTWVVAAVGGSVIAGAAAGLLLAFSYTFWTQAVIAEVYALHLALVALCFAALHAYARRPSRGRLAVFCAVYALGFGNHLSMILLFVPFAAFVVLAHPRPRELFSPAVAGMALLLAAAGALQYTPNFLALWSSVGAPEPPVARLAAFWFDTTKTDWRGTMVLGIDATSLMDRLAMWTWDARQQFGAAGVVVAIAGGIRLWWISRPWAVLVWLAYAISTAFAITYNVGDPHVFFLPGHLLTAFATGMAVVPQRPSRESEGGRPRRPLAPGAATMAAAAVMLAGYACWRGWDTFPAADRHRDYRGEALVDRLLLGVDEQRALFVSSLPWDIENAVLYSARYVHPEVAWLRLPDVSPHFPFLVRDNLAIGRDIVLTSGAAALVLAAYGDLFPIAIDEVPPSPAVSDVAAGIPLGTPYILTRLRPVSPAPDADHELTRSLAQLTGGRPPVRTEADYEVVAGVAGDDPSLYHASDRPFRLDTVLLDERFTIRMDAWMPIDTFRRGGFGHVLRGREPVLFVERGVSLVWFAPDGRPQVMYAGGPYAPQPRARIRAGAARLAWARLPAMAPRDAIVMTCPAGEACDGSNHPRNRGVPWHRGGPFRAGEPLP